MDNFEHPQNPETPVQNNPVQENTSGQNPQYAPPGQSNWFNQNPNAAQTGYAQPPQYPPNQPQYRQGYSQPPYQQPYQQNSIPPGYYPQPVYPPAQKRKEPGVSIASLVVSITGFVLCWVPVLNIILAIVGLILGIVAKKKGGGTFALVGIIVGAAALLFSLLITIPIVIGIIYGLRHYESYYNYVPDFDWSISFSALLR